MGPLQFSPAMSALMLRDGAEGCGSGIVNIDGRASRVAPDVLRYFNQVAVGIPEVHGAQGPKGARSRDGAGDDRDVLGAQVRKHLVQRNGRDQAEVARPARGRVRFRWSFRRPVLKVDLLVPEAQCMPGLPLRPAKELPFEPEGPFVEARGTSGIPTATWLKSRSTSGDDA